MLGEPICTVQFVDWANPDGNDFAIAEEVTLRGGHERRPDIVVWPEGALPATAADVFGDGSPDAAALARVLQPGQSLIMGLSRGEADPSAPEGALP